MKHALNHFKNIEDKLKEKHLLICLDYDGTLTPIAEHPDQAVLTEGEKAFLKKLAARQDCSVVIVSGRSLADVREKVGIKSITYAGNHGFQIEGPVLHFDYLLPLDYKNALQTIHDQLKEISWKTPGAVLEHKNYTLSFHFRKVKEDLQRAARRNFMKVCKPFADRKLIKVTTGKKVLEVRPSIDWNKGHAVLWIYQKLQHLKGKDRVAIIYCGDDTTDEDAFRLLWKRGVNVVVGKDKRSKAEFFAHNCDEVYQFLEKV